jgi:RNA polymerase sigma-70 factor, ECF subfamily
MMDISTGTSCPAQTAEPDDHALAEQACGGDRQAFAALVERHYDFVHRVAWKWSRDRTAAEDIAQNVCLRLGAAIRSWRKESSFTTWLYRLTINAAHDHARAAAREARRADGWATYARTLGDCTDEDETDTDDLWLAVRTLPEKQRDAVLLVYGEELNHAEAARVMDCAESTVSYHLHAARKRLKRILRQAGEE